VDILNDLSAVTNKRQIKACIAGLRDNRTAHIEAVLENKNALRSQIKRICETLDKVMAQGDTLRAK